LVAINVGYGETRTAHRRGQDARAPYGYRPDWSHSDCGPGKPAPLTQTFLAQNPGATIRIDTLSVREIARPLAHFEIDAGLTYLDYQTPPGYRRVELYREQYVLFAPASEPLMRGEKVGWAQAAGLRLRALNSAMRQRRTVPASGGGWRRRAISTSTKCSARL
jgi:DNA-binding transcriptional LysR family regulator